MKTYYDLVLELLTNYPALRDSDKKLIWSVWIREGKVKNGYLALNDFMDAGIAESITRARRKVQEEHPELASSEMIERARKEKEEEGGTFIFRDKIKEKTLDIPVQQSIFI